MSLSHVGTAYILNYFITDKEEDCRRSSFSVAWMQIQNLVHVYRSLHWAKKNTCPCILLIEDSGKDFESKPNTNVHRTRLWNKAPPSASVASVMVRNIYLKCRNVNTSCLNKRFYQCQCLGKDNEGRWDGALYCSLETSSWRKQNGLTSLP